MTEFILGRQIDLDFLSVLPTDEAVVNHAKLKLVELLSAVVADLFEGGPPEKAVMPLVIEVDMDQNGMDYRWTAKVSGQAKAASEEEQERAERELD